MAFILNIETTTDVCSVTLAKSGDIIDCIENDNGNKHSEVLTVYIEEMFKRNNLRLSNLDAVAVSKGPGSYTGLRIGVSVAKGICYGINKPLIAVSTLQSMVNGLTSDDFPCDYKKSDLSKFWFCPMIDARRMEVYSAFFDKSCYQKSDITATIIESETFREILNTRKIVFFGTGAQKCQSTINHENAIFCDSFKMTANNMVSLSENAYQSDEFEDVAYFEPFYLKEFVATTSQKKIL